MTVPPPWTEYTWDGTEGYLWDGKIFISKDYTPETGVAHAFFAPPGGYAAVPAMVQGDPGLPITIRNTTVTELAPDDVTDPSVVFTLITPGDADTQPVYDIAFTLHAGADGIPGAFNFLDAGDLTGTATAGYFPAYTATGPGVVWTPPKVGGVYWPASISSTTSSDGAVRTLAPVSIPAQPFDWRPEAFGQSILTGTGPDCTVDLIARVSNATSGDIVARKYGLALTTPQDLTLVPGPVAGASTSLGKISAGDGPTAIYLRAERQSGSDSFSTSSSTTSFYVKVVPLP